MGWSIGWDDSWDRDIGYGVPSICDHPECEKEIDRGLSYVCADQEPYGGDGCGLYFCGKHKGYYKERVIGEDGEEQEPEISDCCERCRDGLEAFTPKPDLPMWTAFKMVDPSWKLWRIGRGFPEPTQEDFAKMNAYYKKKGWGKYDPEEN